MKMDVTSSRGYCSNGGKGVCIANWNESAVFKNHPEWFVQPNYQLNLAIPEAAAYFKNLLREVVDHYRLDLYRHDFNTPLQGDGLNAVRYGFTESNYWRHYEAFYDAFQHIHESHPRLILQQASGGGTRLDLKTCSIFDEQYTSDRVNSPWVYQMSSGLSVYLPTEIMVTPNGMAGHDQPDYLTVLRAAYFLGNTPMLSTRCCRGAWKTLLSSLGSNFSITLRSTRALSDHCCLLVTCGTTRQLMGLAGSRGGVVCIRVHCT